MSGTTSPLGFPYPTDSDFVTNGDEAIQALAEAVEDYLVGADAALSAGTNVTMGSPNRCYRRGTMVTMLVDDWTTTGSISAGATVATLPAGFRPPFRVRGVVSNFTDALPVALFLDDDGVVTTSNAIGSGKVLKGSITYPVDL